MRSEKTNDPENSTGHRTVLLLSLAIAWLMLACSAESVFLSIYIESKSDALQEAAGTENTSVDFIVVQGESVSEIAESLKVQGLISDPTLFRRYLQYKGLDAGIQAGTHTLNPTMTIPEIAQALQHARAAEQQVTIPEGKRLEEVAVLVAQQTTIPSDTFLSMAQIGWRGTDLTIKHSLLSQVPLTATLEGFLSPDTYRLSMNATTYDLLDRMLINLESHITPEIQQGLTERGLSLYEGVTLASIVEREAVLAEEQSLIAGVYYNRLEDGWPLAADPTVQYALGYQPEAGVWWKKQLYFVDLEVASPYNTYRNVGLPPGPIASPGEGSIHAVAFPAETDYYFFMVDCTKNDGSHVFSKTEAEHLEYFRMCNR